MFNFAQIEETGNKVVAFIQAATDSIARLEASNAELHRKIDEQAAQISRLEAAHESIMGWIAESDDETVADAVSQIEAATTLVADSAQAVQNSAAQVETVAEEIAAEPEAETTVVEENNVIEETPAVPATETPPSETPVNAPAETPIPDVVPPEAPVVRKRKWI